MHTTKSKSCSGTTGKPLTEYSSQADAKEGAIHAKKAHGLDLAPYRCDTCGKWHLSPKSRQTPSRTCVSCTDSSGNRKELYETEAAARKRAQILRREQGVALKVYHCPYNKGYHLAKDG